MSSPTNLVKVKQQVSAIRHQEPFTSLFHAYHELVNGKKIMFGMIEYETRNVNYYERE